MEKKEEKNEEKKDKKYLRREFSYSKFQQSIILPDNVEKNKITAKVEHGILSIDIPKTVDKEVQKSLKKQLVPLKETGCFSVSNGWFLLKEPPVSFKGKMSFHNKLNTSILRTLIFFI